MHSTIKKLKNHNISNFAVFYLLLDIKICAKDSITFVLMHQLRKKCYPPSQSLLPPSRKLSKHHTKN